MNIQSGFIASIAADRIYYKLFSWIIWEEHTLQSRITCLSALGRCNPVGPHRPIALLAVKKHLLAGREVLILDLLRRACQLSLIDGEGDHSHMAHARLMVLSGRTCH